MEIANRTIQLLFVDVLAEVMAHLMFMSIKGMDGLKGNGNGKS